METPYAESRDDSLDATAGALPVRRSISAAALIESSLGFLSLCASLFWAAALAIPGALAARLGDGDMANRIARFGARLITRSCGATVEMRGAEHLAGLGPGNHRRQPQGSFRYHRSRRLSAPRDPIRREKGSASNSFDRSGDRALRAYCSESATRFGNPQGVAGCRSRLQHHCVRGGSPLPRQGCS